MYQFCPCSSSIDPCVLPCYGTCNVAPTSSDYLKTGIRMGASYKKRFPFPIGPKTIAQNFHIKIYSWKHLCVLESHLIFNLIAEFYATVRMSNLFHRCFVVFSLFHLLLPCDLYVTLFMLIQNGGVGRSMCSLGTSFGSVYCACGGSASLISLLATFICFADVPMKPLNIAFSLLLPSL